jgi:UDP:flavonoid glycosyltransferase YjiC (YdhE family)
MGKWVTGFALDGPLNAIRRQLGLKPGRHHWYTEMGAAGLNLGLWSPQFRGTLEGDPQGSRICGFPHFDHDPAQVRGEDALESFLNNGEPPVVFTLGTAVVHARPDFFELAAKAAAAVGCRTVLLTGSSDYAPSGLKEEAIAVPYARFSSLFPRARAVVHHGGIGTMAQAMGAGVPTLIVPAAHDQFDNAARAQRLGVSRTVKIAKITAASLATMLRTVIGDADIAERAGVLATQLSAERGASTAVDAILAYMRSPVHSPT